MAKKTTTTKRASNNLRKPGGARPGYQRITLYLKPEQIKQLKHRAVEDETDVSTTGRAAVSAFFGDKP